MIAVTIKTTTKRLIIHEAESTHKYHHKYPLKKLKQSTYETLGKLEENLTETYFRLFHGAYAPNKQGVKPAGQDTSSYTPFVAASPPDLTRLPHNTPNYTG